MVRNKKGKLEEQVHVYMDEFLGLIAPPVLEPWTVQDVMDNQTGRHDVRRRNHLGQDGSTGDLVGGVYIIPPVAYKLDERLVGALKSGGGKSDIIPVGG